MVPWGDPSTSLLGMGNGNVLPWSKGFWQRGLQLFQMGADAC